MNKSVLKTFATSARKELLKKVEAKAMKIGITEETIKKQILKARMPSLLMVKSFQKKKKLKEPN
ncbi:hypothetical protein ACT7DA_30840 [Bacillus pacificus]